MGIFVYLFTFLIYLFTISPSIWWGDSGELSGVSYTLGVAHSTGYPLYSILSKIFTFIPVSSAGFRCALFSCFFGCLSGLYLFFLLNNFSSNKFCCVSVSLLFSFSKTFWEHSLIAEVHTLNIFLIILFLFSIFKNSFKFLSLSLFLMGLCFTNHNTCISLIPGFLFLIIKRKKLNFKNIPVFLFLFLIPFSLYLYLPLRAIKMPSFNFGAPFTFENFFWLTTGKGASLLNLFDLKNNILFQIKIFSKNIFSQFNIFFVLSLFGFLNLFRKDKDIFYFFILFSSVSFLYALSLGISDIFPYFLPVFLSFCFYIFFAIERWNSSLLLIFPVLVIFGNYSYVNKSKNFSPYNFSLSILKFLPEKSVLITPDNNLAFPLWYLQKVEKKGYDKIVIYRKLLQFRWYQEELRKSFLKIPQNLETTEVFSEDLSKRIMRKIYLTNKNLEFYSTHFEKEIFPEMFFLPTSTVLKISRNREKFSYIPLVDFPDYFEDRTKNIISILLLERAKAFVSLNELNLSILELKRGIKINPHLFHFYNNLGYVYQLKGDLKPAEENYRRVLKLNPGFSLAYTNLGIIYLLQNKMRLAEESFLKALSINRNDQLTLNNLYETGIIYFRRGDLNSAERVFKTLQKFSDSPSLHYALGMTYYRMGKLSLAEKELKKYLKTGKEFRKEVEKLLEEFK